MYVVHTRLNLEYVLSKSAKLCNVNKQYKPPASRLRPKIIQEMIQRVSFYISGIVKVVTHQRVLRAVL